MSVFKAAFSPLWCLSTVALLSSHVLAGGGCDFQFQGALTSPGLLAIQYVESATESVECSFDGGPFELCPNGKSFTIPSTDVYILNFNVTCSDDRETIRDSAQGPFPVNAPGPCPNNAEIVNLRRRSVYNWWRNVRFHWRVVNGKDLRTMCQLNSGPEVPCTSPFDVNQTLYDSLCSKRHKFTVRLYCGPKVLAKDSITARLFTGITCKKRPPCQDVSFSQMPTITGLSSTSPGTTTITAEFATSLPSRCHCKLGSEKRAKPCRSGSSTTVNASSGVFFISCEVKDNCNTIIRHYIPFP